MIEFIIVIFVVGFIVYYLFRHPIESCKVICGIIGLFVLGTLGIIGFLFMMYGILTYLG